MIDWVIYMVLSPKDIVEIDPAILKLTANISTGPIVSAVRKFIAQAEEFGDSTDKMAAEKLKVAYAEVDAIDEFINGDEAKKEVDTLLHLQYSDITATTDRETLEHYRNLILDLLAEDEEFINYYGKTEDERQSLRSRANGMRVAYKTRLDKDNLNNVLDQMYAILNEGGTTVATRNWVNFIKQNSSMFINSSMRPDNTTRYRAVAYQKDKLKSILRGLDFLIGQLDAGHKAQSWRVI